MRAWKNGKPIDYKRFGVEVASRVIAEKHMGHKLPYGAVVHHHDEDIHNNTPTNLVVCPDRAYHSLLHKRMEALKESGNPNNKYCPFCGIWDDPKNLHAIKRKRRIGGYYHPSCKAAYDARRNS